MYHLLAPFELTQKQSTMLYILSCAWAKSVWFGAQWNTRREIQWEEWIKSIQKWVKHVVSRGKSIVIKGEAMAWEI